MAVLKRIVEAIFGKPVTIHDSVFGELQQFGRRKNVASDCCWEGDPSAVQGAELGTIEKPDEMFVFAPATGPTEEQREIFRRFQDHLPLIKSELGKLMLEDNRRWSELAKQELGPPVPVPFPLAETESEAYEMAHFARIEVFGNDQSKSWDIGIYVCIPWEIEHNRSVRIRGNRVTDYYAE